MPASHLVSDPASKPDGKPPLTAAARSEPPAVGSAPGAPPVAMTHTHDPRWQLVLGAGPELLTGVPNALWGVPGRVELRLLRHSLVSPSLVLGFIRTLPADVSFPEGSMRFTLTEGRALLCLLDGRFASLSFRPCVHIGAGALKADAVRVSGGRSTLLAWSELGLLERTVWNFAPHLEFEAQIGLSAPLYRYAFGFEANQPVEYTASFSALGGVGLNFSWDLAENSH